MKWTTKQLTTMALLTAIALAIHVAEAQIPPFVAIPGVKLGLANIVTIYAAFSIGGGAAATANESFGADGLLEAPQYTRPPVYRGMSVPDVLADGDHGAVASWRKRQAIDLTERRRPDLLAQGGTFAIGGEP